MDLVQNDLKCGLVLDHCSVDGTSGWRCRGSELPARSVAMAVTIRRNCPISNSASPAGSAATSLASQGFAFPPEFLEDSSSLSR